MRCSYGEERKKQDGYKTNETVMNEVKKRRTMTNAK